MNLYDALVKVGFRAHEANMLPDFIIRQGTRSLLASRLRCSSKPSAEAQLQDLRDFVKSLKKLPIAIHTEAANEQHYELPAEFYQLVLGKHLKYSCALFNSKLTTLDEAEETMLALYCERACLRDGQTVLDLGCGWGSLSLYIAKNFPNCNITSVSNSTTQKKLIEDECRRNGFLNVTVITCDINSFEANATFDRIFSIEMFEHMKNYEKLLYKISTWMHSESLLFVHIFCHKTFAYHFEDSGEDDWMARYFFTGGTMAADSLLLYFQDNVSIVDHWRVNGKHYSQTSEEWLKKMDSNTKAVKSLFEKTYGPAAGKWWVYWRTFFIAVAELFGYNDGEEWMVSHYLFKKK
ncbi:hypothetical protein GOP47_0013937 [Adiantum capillus-veneris]|uniref:(S)-coclaurine N-methyltransferase n=1 Tax=Adiantum capillus-veneris TaxID=13818 RepID=A0A9D4UQ63_ADICA|nr:hypothetical protein GOP47_0013937 [Adiantum capillus-veneris]